MRRPATNASAPDAPDCSKPQYGRAQVKLRVESLCLKYGSHAALEDLDLELYAGEILAIIGPSGSGKSSFLQTLNRLTDLIPQANRSGRILLDGADILSADCDVQQLRRRVGMIFQKPNPFPLSIRKNIEFPLREHGVRMRSQREEIVRQTLVDVGLWDEVHDRLDRSAVELSGGQQQRLCLARALALRPEVLLLDEPCSALDPVATEKIERLFLSLRRRLTLAVVTHNLAQAKRIADRVAVLWSQDGTGRLIECGTAQEVFETPRHPAAAAYVQGRAG